MSDVGGWLPSWLSPERLPLLWAVWLIVAGFCSLMKRQRAVERVLLGLFGTGPAPLLVVGTWPLLAFGCESFALPGDRERDREQRQPQPRPIESAPASASAAGAPSVIVPVLSLGGAPAYEPEPEPCAVAAENGAIFCEPGAAKLEYCVEAPLEGEPCPTLEHPPEWAYELLLQCIAHCGVGIISSSRELEGACCYIAASEYYGR